MNVTESRQVAAVLRGVYIDHDPAAALHTARDLAGRTRKVLLHTGIPYVAPHLLTAPPADDDSPRCVRCGCTDEQACPGGCWWVPGPADGDLCSRCAAELALIAEALKAAAGQVADEDRAAQYRELLAGSYSAYLVAEDGS